MKRVKSFIKRVSKYYLDAYIAVYGPMLEAGFTPIM